MSNVPHDARLARRIWGRDPARPCRFLFSRDAGPGLVIEATSAAGTTAWNAARDGLKETAPQDAKVFSGALVVDRAGRFVFCGKRAGAELLRELATWAAEALPTNPAVVGLVDAGVATVDVDLADTAAIAALDPAKLDVERDPALWDALFRPSAAGTAAALAAALPGQRLWFWLWGDAPEGLPVLLAERVADDPVLDRLNHAISQLPVLTDDEVVTGVATVVADGRVQLQARRLHPGLLLALAGWVREQAAEHPGLLRLVGCQLVVVGADGRVAAVHEDAEAWTSLVAPPAPSTPAEAAAVLRGLAAGDAAWFFATPNGLDGALLTALAVADDPEGEAFRARVAHLHAQHPKAREAFVDGTVRRLRSGALLFTTSRESVAPWAAVVKGLRTTSPELAELAGDKLVVVSGEGITKTASVG